MYNTERYRPTYYGQDRAADFLDTRVSLRRILAARFDGSKRRVSLPTPLWTRSFAKRSGGVSMKRRRMKSISLPRSIRGFSMYRCF